MIISIQVIDGEETTSVEKDLAVECPPMVHEIRLVQVLLKQAGAEITLAGIIAGAASLGIDAHMESHFGSRSQSLREKFLAKLRENPRYTD